MRLVRTAYILLIDKPEREEPTELLCGTMKSAEHWAEIFARKHGGDSVEIVKRHYYEYDERIKEEADGEA